MDTMQLMYAYAYPLQMNTRPADDTGSEETPMGVPAGRRQAESQSGTVAYLCIGDHLLRNHAR